MENQVKKKKQQFRREIRNQDLNKWRHQIRKKLPYYQNYAEQSNKDSSSNSRSSRFPLRAPHQNSILDRKIFSQIQMKRVFGNQCIYDMDQLKDLITVALMTKSYELMDLQNNQMQDQQGNEYKIDVDWSFYIACYYLCDINHWDGLINDLFCFFTSYYIKWLDVHLLEKLISLGTLDDFKQYLQNVIQINDIKIQCIILNQLKRIQNIQNQFQKSYLLKKYLENMFNYLNSKINMFIKVQKLLGQKYQQQIIVQKLRLDQDQKMFEWTQWVYNSQLSDTVLKIFYLIQEESSNLNNKMGKQRIFFYCKYLTYFPYTIYCQNQSQINEQIMNIQIQLVKNYIQPYIHQLGKYLSQGIFLSNQTQSSNQNNNTIIQTDLKILSTILSYYQSLFGKQFDDSCYRSIYYSWRKIIQILQRFIPYLKLKNSLQINEQIWKMHSNNIGIFINFYRMFMFQDYDNGEIFNNSMVRYFKQILVSFCQIQVEIKEMVAKGEQKYQDFKCTEQRNTRQYWIQFQVLVYLLILTLNQLETNNQLCQQSQKNVDEFLTLADKMFTHLKVFKNCNNIFIEENKLIMNQIGNVDRESKSKSDNKTNISQKMMLINPEINLKVYNFQISSQNEQVDI